VISDSSYLLTARWRGGNAKTVWRVTESAYDEAAYDRPITISWAVIRGIVAKSLRSLPLESVSGGVEGSTGGNYLEKNRIFPYFGFASDPIPLIVRPPTSEWATAL